MANPKRQVMLMHGNNEVARTVNGTVSGDWDIKMNHLLPVGWNLRSPLKEIEDALAKYSKNKKYSDYDNIMFLLGDYRSTDAASTNCNDAENDIRDKIRDKIMDEVRDNNNNTVLNWLSHRILPIDRQNAKKLYQVFGLSQVNSIRERVKNSLYLNAQSILDSYWITYDNENLTWDSINLRKNQLSNGIAVLALTGSSVSLQESDLTNLLAASADLTAHGTYPKGIFRENDSLYMYKSGDLYTVAAEIAASDILDCSNVFGHVKYEYAVKSGVKCSKCKLMTSDEIDIVPAADLKNAIVLAKDKFRNELAQMIVVDFILGNIDRHNMNWGFFRDTKSGKITGLHWLFDHNNSFDQAQYFGKTSDISSFSVLSQDPMVGRIGLKEAVDYMRRYSDFRFITPIPKSAFKLFGMKAKAIIKEFVKRCEYLGIDVKIK